MFNPLASSNSSQPLAATYRKHEKWKIWAYEQRVWEIEHWSFTPLIMSSTGGIGSATNVCYKRLASLLSAEWNLPYTSALTWIQCILSFALLRSSIQCIRATWWSSILLKHPCHLTAYYGRDHQSLIFERSVKHLCTGSHTTLKQYYYYYHLKIPLFNSLMHSFHWLLHFPFISWRGAKVPIIVYWETDSRCWKPGDAAPLQLL